MGKYKFTFTNIIFWVAVIASIFIFENITFFDKPTINGFMNLGMADPYFFMLAALAGLCFVFLIIYESIVNKAKTNWVILACCLALLGCGIAGIWLFNGMEFASGAEAMVIDDWQKIKHTISFGLFVLTIYSTFFYFTNSHPSIKRLRILLLIVILVIYFFAIFSVVTEYAKYEIIANTKEEEVIASQNIKSLFLNSNMFAGFMFMGIAAAIGFNYFKKNIFSYITIIGFLIIQVFTCSLTGILTSVLLVFLYFLLETILSFKYSLTVGLFKLALHLIITIGVIIFFAMCQTYEVGHFTTFFRFLFKEISRTDYSTFSHRVNIWNNTLYASNQNIFTLLFGYGFRNSEYVVGGLLNITGHRISSHNGYLQLLLNFGVVGLAAFAVFVFFYFFAIIRMMKNHTRFSLVFLLIGVAYFAYSVTESLIAFNASATGILIGALFYLPVINRYLHYRHQEVGDSAIEEHTLPKLLEPKFMVRGTARAILGAAAIVGSFLMFDECRNDYNIFYTLINLEVILGAALFFVPYLNGLWAKSGKVSSYIVNLSIFALLMVIASVPLSVIYMLNDNLGYFFKWYASIAIMGTMLVLTIIYAISCKGSFLLYLNTFVAFKTSLGSLIGVGGYLVGLYFLKWYLIPYSLITYIVNGLFVAVVFYLFSLVVPFKDVVVITKFNHEFNAHWMKLDVIRDRLEEPYAI